ncbi:hypothetical protein [Pediococcus acidilactici]|uniref:hypothetical protein n=1 Tax=Pediococcus acidilactici TaxID=1254 RepID=UPI003CFAEB8B
MTVEPHAKGSVNPVLVIDENDVGPATPLVSASMTKMHFTTYKAGDWRWRRQSKF